MSNVEREPVDETRRLVRDWGILLKYRDYLHAWKRIFDYWPAPEETFDNIIRYSNPIGKNIEYYVCDDTVLRKIIRWLQQNWSRNIRYLSSAINEEKPNRVTIYAHDWTPMNTIVITEIRDRCETTQITSHYLIYLFANLFITITHCALALIFIIYWQNYLFVIFIEQLYLSNYLFKGDLTTCDNYLFKEIIISSWQMITINR